nr:AsmA family protein [Raoultella sp. NCTC 9187]
MKFPGKLILWLLTALLVVIVAAWFLLQTHWGSRQASAWLSDGTGWQVSSMRWITTSLRLSTCSCRT